MGEAKRRQQVATARPFHNVDTDERGVMRYGGDPEAYIDKVANGREAPVPCNGCTECCFYNRVEVNPEKERPEDLAHLLTELDPDGVMRLRKRDDGGCIHLGETECTVYNHRPTACRKYDCRMYSLFGLRDTYPGGHSSPVWSFQPRTRHGHFVVEAHQAAAVIAVGELNQKGKSWTAEDAMMLAAKKVPDIVQAMEMVSRLSLENKIKVLGFDPNAITIEEVIQAKLNVYKSASQKRAE